MNVDKILSRRSSPVPEQPWFDLFCFQRLSQQRVFKEVDLADAKIIRGSPVAVHLAEHFGQQRTVGLWCFCRTVTVGCDRGRQRRIEDELDRLTGLTQVLAPRRSAVLINAERLF